MNKQCKLCQATFEITDGDLEFYHKVSPLLNGLPLPRRHPDQRHIDRMQLRNPRKLVTRFCESCGESTQSTFPLDSTEMVYCGSCYEQAVYSN